MGSFISHVMVFPSLLPVASLCFHRTSAVIFNNLTQSLSSSLDWVSIERSMDKYWTKYGAGMGRVQYEPFGHYISWQIPTNMG